MHEKIRKTKRLKFYNTSLVYKAFLIMILLPLDILFMESYYNIEYQINKDISKIEPKEYPLNLTYIKKDFLYLAQKYKYLLKEERKTISDNCPIWTMWYQGLKNAPPIVLSCIKSIIMNKGNHPLYIIDKYNLDKYIKLPSYIYEKLNDKNITFTQLSNIVRVGLLSKYGGYWIDSTYFITTIPKKVNKTFYTLKLNYCFRLGHPFVKCKWSVNFMATTKKSFIATYSYVALLYYWKKYNSLIFYFFLDYIIHIAYYNVLEFKDKIEELPYTTCNIFALANALNSRYNKSYFSCSFNKLSKNYKWSLIDRNKTTNYAHLIENYKLDYESINN